MTSCTRQWHEVVRNPLAALGDAQPISERSFPSIAGLTVAARRICVLKTFCQKLMEAKTMNCPACGKGISEGSEFCEFCGASLKASPSAGAPGVAVPPMNPGVVSRSPVQPAGAPSAAEFAQMGGMLVRSMSLGEKLAGGGAIAAALGFFLPWASGPDLRSLGNLSAAMLMRGIGTTTFSGLDAAKLWGAVYFILAAAIASGILSYTSRKALFSRKLTISGFQVMIGSLLGPAVLFTLLFVPFMQSVAGFGLWLMGLGFCSIAAGGLVTISQLGGMVQ